MNDGLFGACFSVFRQKEGAIAPVDYLSTFATAPFLLSQIKSLGSALSILSFAIFGVNLFFIFFDMAYISCIHSTIYGLYGQQTHDVAV